jgi:hypothetical protein
MRRSGAWLIYDLRSEKNYRLGMDDSGDAVWRGGGAGSRSGDRSFT